MRARVAQATVRVWVEGRDDPCSLTVLVDPEGVDLSRPECFSPRAFMKSPSIYKRVRVRGVSLRAERSNLAASLSERVLSASTLTCSWPFAVAAPQTRLQSIPLRQGPARRHPQGAPAT